MADGRFTPNHVNIGRYMADLGCDPTGSTLGDKLVIPGEMLSFTFERTGKNKFRVTSKLTHPEYGELGKWDYGEHTIREKGDTFTLQTSRRCYNVSVTS